VKVKRDVINPETTNMAVESTRREFFRACFRYPVLAGLGVLGGVLAMRGLQSNGVVPCIKSRVCRDCGLFVNCEKPQASEARNSVGGS
jgi:hypothetical protein